jgi:hypothetical protein
LNLRYKDWVFAARLLIGLNRYASRHILIATSLKLSIKRSLCRMLRLRITRARRLRLWIFSTTP